MVKTRPERVAPRVAGVILAAGPATRFDGPRYKLLMPFRQEPIIYWVAKHALGSRLERVLVVTGHREKAVRRALAPLAASPKLGLVSNPHYLQGRATSIRCGLSALPTHAEYAMFLLGDQPLISTDLIDGLITLIEREPQAPLYFPTVCGRKGNPAVYSRHLFDSLRAIEGDQSGLPLIQEHWQAAGTIPLPDATSQLNINTYEDYQALLGEGGDPEDPSPERGYSARETSRRGRRTPA